LSTTNTAKTALLRLLKLLIIGVCVLFVYLVLIKNPQEEIPEPNIESTAEVIELIGPQGERGEAGIPGKDGEIITKTIYIDSTNTTNEIDHWEPNECSDAQILKFNAIEGEWECAYDQRGGSGGSTTNNYYSGGGVFVGMTSSNYNGNITNGSDDGYVAANTICASEYAESHICQTNEILNTINSEDISGFSGTAWIAEGPPGYLADANDCMGFTDDSPTSLGSFWEFVNTNGGRGWLVNCSVSKPIACCR
jgi:hypothetical protein